jgi:universal stress protein A
MENYRQILLSTDLTEENHSVVNRAVYFAELMQAKLDVVHVVEPLPGYGYAYVGVTDIEGQLIEEAKAEMVRLGEKFAISNERQWIEVGSTKLQILHVAEKIEADLIILGSHGRHGVSELLGSTTHGLIHGARCDVLTIRVGKEA